MKRQPKQFNPAKHIEKFFGRDLEEYIKQDTKDSALQDSIREYMRGRFDLEDVKEDPGLPGMENVVREMISDYNHNKTKNKNNEKFIRDAFSEIPDEQLLDEINNIRYELTNNNIADISAEWVKEWHEDRQKKGALSARRMEIKEFINSSLEVEDKKPELILKTGTRNSFSPRLIRYVSLAAAVLAGALFIINTLVPVSDPDKLFNSFYEAPAAISPVTRSITDNLSFVYTSAIEDYKKGDYQGASIGFSSSILQDQSALAPRFLLAITDIELANYDKAITILSDISARYGEYSKEAKWYLGLTYLKTGEKDKAFECFNSLAKCSGYYSKRSEKILRGLR